MMHLEGIHHITAITGDAPRNVDFYARLLGQRLVKKTVNFDAPDVYHLYYGDERGAPGSILTFFEFPDAAPGRAGAGMIHRLRWRVASRDALAFWSERLQDDGVHHIAWGPRDEEHASWRERLAAAGERPTPVIDRQYFRSIYFREPRGVLFELATPSPGFAIDEDPEHLGEQLRLPPQHEHLRDQLEATLTPLVNPRARAARP